MDSPAPLSTFSLTWCTATASTSFQVKAQQIRFVGDNRTPVPWLHSQESCLRSLLQVLLFTQLHFEGATKNPGNAPLPCFNNLCTNTMKVRSVQAFPQIIHAAKMKRPQSDGERKGKVCVGGWRKWRLRSTRCRSSCLPWQTPFFPIQQHDASRKHRSRCQGTSPNVFILPSLLRYPLTSHFSSLHLSPYIVNGDNHNTCTLKLKNICENHTNIFHK